MKNQKLRSLTWQYFIERKIKEVFLTIFILSLIVFIPYLVGSSIGDNKSVYCDLSDYCQDSYNWDVCDENAQCGEFNQWAEGLGYLAGASFILCFIGFIIYFWFSSNWEKAQEKARKELKK